MDMKKMLTAMGSVLALAGCATVSDYEKCVDDATKDYEALTGAISITEANLARGYAVHRSSQPYTYAGTCYDYQYQVSYSCPKNGYMTVSEPVAIDADLERQKLDMLRRQLNDSTRRANQGVAACQRQYPEG